ncbi:uncharacterized protein PG986_007620 [Apiospora aurea]|uniref:DUF7892 domain-containing protein n=1 Tax=Apiospora aurea TaxID=335848 RepID=A0ABR1QD39_9PEZI
MAGISEQASLDVAPASLNAEREDWPMTTEVNSGFGRPDDTSSPDILTTSEADVGGRSSSEQHRMTDAVGVASPTIVNHSSETNSETRKRKSSHDGHLAQAAEESVKKAKVEEAPAGTLLQQSASPAGCHESERYSLPAEIWQHIFTFVSPRELGNLLLTNRTFHSYLDPSPTVNGHTTCPSVTSKGHLPKLKPDVIWQTSRRRCWPRMPAPLRNHTELQMWRLACCRKCQFCGKREPPSPVIANHKARSGPGEHGISIIWPFAVSSCGPCLLDKSLKEIDLLLSSTPSLIIPALPSVLLTEEKNILSPGALQNVQGHSDVKLTKLFYTKHVEELKDEFATVKAMGLATVEEWLKGLDDRGKELRGDSSRWEKWESAGGVSQMRKSLRQMQVEPSPDTSHEGTPSGAHNKVSHDGKIQPSSGLSIPVFTTVPVDAHTKNTASHLAHNQEPFSCPVPNRSRTQEEIQEMKAARRLEIERRAALLEPPLLPNVLAHIPSFQAALQIIQPLDDNAWELLKPRLLSQREDADIRASQDRRLNAHPIAAQVKTEDRSDGHGTQRGSKELVDKDWDDAQAPLRAKISEYADETIKNAWHNGHKVKKDSCPKFSADVLLYVRKRFYAEVAKDAVAARAAGKDPICDPPEGPFTQKLTLENMKWLFEVKIKPLTESYRKELFLCNGCDGNSKAYGFEGVIQHYAAKHTSSLSQGNIVVYWRSEWPATPPFHPDPLSKSTTTATGTPTSYPGIYQPQYPAQPPINPFPQPRPFPHQGDLGYGAPYRPDFGAHQHPHYPQYPASQPPFSIPPSYDTSYHTPFERPGISQQNMPPIVPSYQQQHHFPSPHEHNTVAYQRNHIDYGLYSEDKNRAQLDDLAFNSRDVWMALTSLRDLPGNIRVSIVIFHLTKRYRSRFSESPPLAMFIDGLSNKKEMRPVRNTNGLKCKACCLHLDDGAEMELRAFSLPQLANHFQQIHIGPFQSAGAPFLDWTVDMIHVPDLSGLSNLPGMDAQKEAIITEAFPISMVPFSYGQPQEVRETIAEWVGTEGYPSTVTGTRHEGEHQAVPISHPPQPGAPLNPSPDYGARPSMTPKQKSHGKSRDQKSSSKEKRKGHNHGNLKRKSNAKSNDIAAKMGRSSHDERDGEAEAEESRQEEAIRAMWAAERRETARLASAPGGLEEKRESPKNGGMPTVTKGVVEVSPLPMPTETEPGDDLFSGLESHLNQQAGSDHNVAGREAIYSRHPTDEPHQPVVLMRPVSQALHSEFISYGQISPTRSGREDDRLQVIHHREPSSQLHQDRTLYIPPTQTPSCNEVRTVRPVATVHDVAIEQIHRIDSSRSHLTGERGGRVFRSPNAEEYAEEPGIRREQARIQYVETYELVRMRDAEGEYFIRRPVRREMDTTYAGPRRLEHRETGSPSLNYGHGSITLSPAHEPSPGSERIIRRPLREEFREPGSLHYQEYDPRFGSAPPNSEAPVR